MTAGLQIRPMHADDVDAVLALAARLDQAPQWPRSSYEAALSPEATPLRLCFVAILPESPLAGFVIASVLPPEAEIESIAVAPEAQRRGIGRTLLQATLAELAARGITDVLLEVRASNHPAHALYRAAGFALVGRRTGYYSHPPEDALLFRRSLASGQEH